MSEPSKNNHLKQAVESREARELLWKTHGERPLARNIAMIGAIGWLVVVPMIGGILLGRWLDRQFASGIMYSAALLLAGAVLGGWLAWKRMNAE